MSIQLHTVDNGNVQAINDGRLYGEITGNVGGIVNGSVVTSAGGLALHVTSGWGIGYGRVFTITADDYTVQPASSGTQKGRLYVHIDISQPDNPIDIRSVAAASLPALIQQNLSEGGAIYEIELAHYDVTALAVSNLVSNTKVKFLGHAGEANNALQLGGVAASGYMVNTQTTREATSANQYITIAEGTNNNVFIKVGKLVWYYLRVNVLSGYSAYSTRVNVPYRAPRYMLANAFDAAGNRLLIAFDNAGHLQIGSATPGLYHLSGTYITTD